MWEQDFHSKVFVEKYIFRMLNFLLQFFWIDVRLVSSTVSEC